jgi:hypothetical protein
MLLPLDAEQRFLNAAGAFDSREEHQMPRDATGVAARLSIE